MFVSVLPFGTPAPVAIRNVILKILAIFGDDFVVIWQNLRDILLCPFYLFIDKLGFFVKHIKRVNFAPLA